MFSMPPAKTGMALSTISARVRGSGWLARSVRSPRAFGVERVGHGLADAFQLGVDMAKGFRVVHGREEVKDGRAEGGKGLRIFSQPHRQSGT